ncbi:glycosyltransferase family 2 protein [Kaistella faecalis]|uniref:glycosyltransferase family 2 protein n=1 Tax=Kaistella faecalis TaxID=2852098 RepID=UPI001E2B283F|nr:glycosyltransferase [Chryseobacterium faecale]UFK97093.1 glycosyltransferase [Chryseobacterium faecale]
MELPKVSVVTITYGHEKYISETLDGVLMQQYDGPVEFIIANDNSPDATDGVVKKYFLENSAPSNFEIKYTKHTTNKGMMPNFIWALEQATGKYIALCEGDDYWTDPLKLQKQVDFLEENEEYVLTFHDVKIVNEDKIISPNKIPKKNRRDLAAKEMCGSITIPTLSIVFRNFCNSFIEFMPNVVNGDKVLIAFLSEYGKAKYLHFSSGAHYRIHETGVWSLLDTDAKNKNNFKTFFELSKLPFKHKNQLKKNALLFLFEIKKTDIAFYKSYIRHFSFVEKIFLRIKLIVLKILKV